MISIMRKDEKMSTSRSSFRDASPWRRLAWPRSGSGRSNEQREGELQSLPKPSRWGPLVGGGALTALGITRRSLGGLALAGAGGWLIYRGVRDRGKGIGVQVRTSFTINKPLEDIWLFWRNFENLPCFMTHLDSVKVSSDRYSFWTANSPLGKVSWHVEIVDERANEYLVWRSLPGSAVENQGSIELRPAPAGRGVEIRVVLDYRPPSRRVSATVAALFGEAAEWQVREDLRHFKQLMEAGEIPTTEGQPHGRRSLLVEAARAMWRAPEERQRPALVRNA
jgi:uncharacterized membrane protein